MRKRVGAAVIAVLSTGGLLLGTGAAQAATGKNIPYTETTDGNPGGSAEFKWNGDILVACDNQADGYGVRATLYNSAGTALKHVDDPQSDNTCIANSANITDGIGVRLTVCLYKGGIYTYWCRTSAWGVS
ncbi:hypothetical protein [Streptomyces sp. NPDC020917]|uniref:hypothetical protein n=1 Tax=Streptomyces sp. NPDC020917 TaxID=3365102 RepID=UPI0037B50B4C